MACIRVGVQGQDRAACRQSDGDAALTAELQQRDHDFDGRRSVFVRSAPAVCLIVKASGDRGRSQGDNRATRHDYRFGSLVLLPSNCDVGEIQLCAGRVSDNATHHARNSGATNNGARPTSLCLDSKRQPRPAPERPRLRPEQLRSVRHFDDSRRKAHDATRCRILGRRLRLRPYPALKQRQ